MAKENPFLPNVGKPLREFANLLVDLHDPRFSRESVHHAIEAFDRERGIRIDRYHQTPESILSWIDQEFGGVWSSEAARSGVWLAREGDRRLGFAAYDARGLRFAWLRRLQEDAGIGIFGPFGVIPEFRKQGLGPVLLAASMIALAERGYRQALIPAVGPRLVHYYGELTGGHVVERFPLPSPHRPYRTTVLASGNGSNFQAVIDGMAAGRLPLDVRLLVVNRRDAFALERARRNAIDSRTFVWDRKGVSREAYDDSVLSAVSESKPELVLLLGWMHVLGPDFIENFPQTLNIHPGLLPYDARADRVTMPDGEETPVFLGAHAVDDALAAGAGWIGASVHRLSCEVDRGEVLARAPLRVNPTESRDQLDARLHELEHKVLERAILRWTYEFTTLQ